MNPITLLNLFNKKEAWEMIKTSTRLNTVIWQDKEND